MQHHGNKPVIYLDQNWLSEITKAHLSSGTSMGRCYYLKMSHGPPTRCSTGQVCLPNVLLS